MNYHIWILLLLAFLPELQLIDIMKITLAHHDIASRYEPYVPKRNVLVDIDNDRENFPQNFTNIIQSRIIDSYISNIADRVAKGSPIIRIVSGDILVIRETNGNITMFPIESETISEPGSIAHNYDLLMIQHKFSTRIRDEIIANIQADDVLHKIPSSANGANFEYVAIISNVTDSYETLWYEVYSDEDTSLYSLFNETLFYFKNQFIEINTSDNDHVKIEPDPYGFNDVDEIDDIPMDDSFDVDSDVDSDDSEDSFDVDSDVDSDDSFDEY